MLFVMPIFEGQTRFEDEPHRQLILNIYLFAVLFMMIAIFLKDA